MRRRSEGLIFNAEQEEWAGRKIFNAERAEEERRRRGLATSASPTWDGAQWIFWAAVMIGCQMPRITRPTVKMRTSIRSLSKSAKKTAICSWADWA